MTLAPHAGSRREFLIGAGAAALAAGLKAPVAHAAKGRFGIAYTSFAVRLRQGRDLIRGGPGRLGAALPAETFLELCRGFGADGAQMDIAQLSSTAPEHLDGLRRRFVEGGMFLELSIDGKTLEDEARFAEAVGVARRLGAVRFRVALLSGRRYEDFPTVAKWQEFAEHWKTALPKTKAWVERHGIPVGIENHKDFRTAELVALLRSVASPLVGACLDFGNNLAFLEDPLELAESLAPFALTTHLKDMAVRPYDEGFELSEVPLGTGLLPLARMVEVIRKARPEAPLVLEMITRDPLKVPYLGDAYWATFGGRDARIVERFRETALSKAWKDPLPRVTGLSPEQMIAAEDDNVRRCAAYARTALGA